MIELEALAQELLKEDEAIISAHVNPDGDALGSMLGLRLVFEKLGKKVLCVIDDQSKVDNKMKFLPGADAVLPASHHCDSVPVFISLDTPSRKRLGVTSTTLLERAQRSYSLDHHTHVDINPDYLYYDTSIPSSSSLVWELSKLMLGYSDREVALCCYTGLLTDTNCFQNKNTNAYAFIIAHEMTKAGIIPSQIAESIYQRKTVSVLKLSTIMFNHLVANTEAAYAYSWISQKDLEECSASIYDTDSFISEIRSLDGIRIACFIKEDVHEIRVSLRAKDDTDVAEIASRFGGGGHKAAAGFSLHGSMEEAIQTITDYLDGITVLEAL